MISDCTCWGLVHVLLTSRHCKTSCIGGTRSYSHGHYAAPVVLRSGRRSWYQRIRYCWSLLVGNGVGFQTLGKIACSDQEVTVSLVALWEGSCYIDGYPFEWGTHTVLMHLVPIPGSGGHDWLHRCHTADTTSQHHFLPGASSTFARPYSGSCWHQIDILMVHHVVWSAYCSLFSDRELSWLHMVNWEGRGSKKSWSLQETVLTFDQEDHKTTQLWLSMPKLRIKPEIS
jgi:hypothetical protein